MVNGGRWTEARFRSFIISALRGAHGKWGVKHDCKAEARVSRGLYECAECHTIGAATLPPKEGNKRRRNNAAVDHINPVVEPEVGFVDWNTYIERMFLEAEGYQVLCDNCHSAKTAEERTRRKKK
tara:strand:+ start:893 stop:1267 length:375 start_codon:yes stop_codon:yes gene_type:complete